MQRADLEALCEPFTPEEVLDGIQDLYDHLLYSTVLDEGDLALVSLKAGIEVLKKMIEDTNGPDLPPSVQIRRMTF